MGRKLALLKWCRQIGFVMAELPLSNTKITQQVQHQVECTHERNLGSSKVLELYGLRCRARSSNCRSYSWEQFLGQWSIEYQGAGL